MFVKFTEFPLKEKPPGPVQVTLIPVWGTTFKLIDCPWQVFVFPVITSVLAGIPNSRLMLSLETQVPLKTVTKYFPDVETLKLVSVEVVLQTKLKP